MDRLHSIWIDYAQYGLIAYLLWRHCVLIADAQPWRQTAVFLNISNQPQSFHGSMRILVDSGGSWRIAIHNEPGMCDPSLRGKRIRELDNTDLLRWFEAEVVIHGEESLQERITILLPYASNRLYQGKNGLASCLLFGLQ